MGQDTAPNDRVYVLSHGDKDGNVIFSNKTRVPYREATALIPVRAEAYGFVIQSKVHCFNHRETATPHFDYVMRHDVVSTTDDAAPGSEFTYNVPVAYLDGSHGFAHTGLNPEVTYRPENGDAFKILYSRPNEEDRKNFKLSQEFMDLSDWDSLA